MTTTRARRAREKRIRWIRKEIRQRAEALETWTSYGHADQGGEVFIAEVNMPIPNLSPINIYGVRPKMSELTRIHVHAPTVLRLARLAGLR